LQGHILSTTGDAALGLFQDSLRALKSVQFFEVSGSTGFDCCTSSKISSAGSHTERRWICQMVCTLSCALLVDGVRDPLGIMFYEQQLV
jgi:hypothetical protein